MSQCSLIFVVLVFLVLVFRVLVFSVLVLVLEKGSLMCLFSYF